MFNKNPKKMKKYLVLISLLTLIFSTVYPQSASLTVFSQDGEKFWVIMNGVRQNPTPETNVVITGLTENNYRLKVIFEDEKLKSIDRNISPHGVDGLMHQTQVIRRDRKGRHIMRISSFEPVTAVAPKTESGQASYAYSTQERPAASPTKAPPAEVREQHAAGIVQTDISASEDRLTTGITVRDPETGEVITVGFDVSETGFGTHIETPEGKVGIGMDVHLTDHSGKVTTTTTTTTTSITTSSHGHYVEEVSPAPPAPPAYVLPGYNGPVGCPYPMSNSDFNNAKKSISSKTFEDSKLTIAKQITSANCLLANQVREVMSLFSFEDSKLEFAKHAYPNTFDIGNYYKVNDAFTFEMTIDELNKFIERQRR